MSKGTDAPPMNDYKAKIEAILTPLQVLAITGSSRDYDVAELHEEATASLLQLLTEARIEELEYLLNYEPTNRALEFNNAWRPGKLYIKNRIAELKDEGNRSK